MTRLLHRLAAAGLSALAAVLPAAADTPLVPYEVIARPAENVEVRRYGPRLVAETRADDSGDAFRRLFRYIAGATAAGGEIAMPAPVESAPAVSEKIAMTAPVETSDDGDVMTMRFFLPEGMTLDAAPRPTDPAVTLRELAPRTEAALTFSGYVFVSGALKRGPTLREALEGSGWTPQGEAKAYLYDPPWTLPWNRRNEVVVEVSRTPSG